MFLSDVETFMIPGSLLRSLLKAKAAKKLISYH